jgi:hypothetical protein
MKQVWQTDDGHLFDSEEKAVRHEQNKQLRQKLITYIASAWWGDDHKDVMYDFVDYFISFISSEKDTILKMLTPIIEKEERSSAYSPTRGVVVVSRTSSGARYQLRNCIISELILAVEDALARLKYEYTLSPIRNLTNIQSLAARITAAVENIERIERKANG